MRRLIAKLVYVYEKALGIDQDKLMIARTKEMIERSNALLGR